VLAGDSKGAAHDLAVRSAAAAEQLAAVEAVLVDVHRESPRDVLRHPAGLNDTLVDVINTVSISDTAPTTQAAAVAKEVITRAAAEIAKVERLVTTEIAAVNRLALERRLQRRTLALSRPPASGRRRRAKNGAGPAPKRPTAPR
jgi:hypothetical protein